MFRTRIAASGAVVLSEDVVCDGFLASAKVRVQSHVHDDHMNGFEASKIQTIVCSAGTRNLLIAEFNADLRYRANLQAVEVGSTHKIEGSTIDLEDARHMLGSVQTALTLEDGYRVGYSGDFGWPIENPIQVDELIVDSTYGSPASVRSYSQEDAEQRFVSVALEKSKVGAVLVHAHRGTLQRAIALMDDAVDHPLIASKRQLRESEVYARSGVVQAPLIDERSPEGREALTSGRYIKFVGKGDTRVEPRGGEYKVTLSAFMVNGEEPMLELSDVSCRVALSNHADFDETIQYVEATGAKKVLTDNVRGPHGAALALELRARLGVEAIPADPQVDRSWGGGS